LTIGCILKLTFKVENDRNSLRDTFETVEGRTLATRIAFVWILKHRHTGTNDILFQFPHGKSEDVRSDYYCFLQIKSLNFYKVISRMSAMSQTFRVPSSDAETMNRSSLEMQQELTPSPYAWFSRVLRRDPDPTSHIFKVLSLDAETMNRSSLEIQQEFTGCVWPSSVLTRDPDSTSHIFKVQSSDAETMNRSSLEIQQESASSSSTTS